MNYTDPISGAVIENVPLLHLNGSGYENLKHKYRLAIESIRAAEDIAKEAAPHPRDFYPLADDSYQAARQQFFQDMDRLQTVRSRFELLFMAIDAQKERRT